MADCASRVASSQVEATRSATAVHGCDWTAFRTATSAGVDFLVGVLAERAETLGEPYTPPRSGTTVGSLGRSVVIR